MERVTGIEPAFKAWEALILPLNYTRFEQMDCIYQKELKSIKKISFQQLLMMFI